jgi:hypothetical protein
MQRSIKSVQGLTALTALAAAAVLATGCASSQRHVLLKEYGPTVAPRADQSLKGITVCIQGFQCAPNLVSPDPSTRPESLTDFTAIPFTDEQQTAWVAETKTRKQSTTQADWREIGNVRTGIGAVTGHVYALNDPGAWLAETLKLDLEGQGARVVEASQSDSADICVAGTIQFCRVDMYMKIWCDLVVDVEFRPQGRPAARRILHTAGGSSSVLSTSDTQFYKALRECRQKFAHLAILEIVQALQPAATGTSASPQVAK